MATTIPQALPNFNYNATIGAANTLSTISGNSGVNNITTSSIIRVIAQASASDVQFSLQNQQLTLQQAYTDTATGQFLNYKGDDYGVQRNILDQIIIFATDQAVQIVPIANNVTFGQALLTNLTIPANTQIATLNNKYSIFTIGAVNLISGNSSQYIDCIIQPTNLNLNNTVNTDETTITINQDQLVPLFANAVLLPIFSSNLQLEFTQPVTIEMANESDDDYRTRIFAAKNAPSTGTVEAISSILAEVPQLLGYNIQVGTRSKNSLDINIVTQSYISGQNYAFIPLYVQNFAQSFFTINTDILVQFPSQLEIFIQYTTGTAEVISNTTINSTIQSIFNTTFIYSQANLISFSQLQTLVTQALPQLSKFIINNISGYDPNLGLYIFNATTDVTVPVGYYSYINVLTNLTNLANPNGS